MGHPLRLAPDASLFGLAPCGVLPATRVATGAVRSYRTFSPLPASRRFTPSASIRRHLRGVAGLALDRGPRHSGSTGTTPAVCFLCHCPSGCPDRALPGALPCGVRTFLPPSPYGLRRGKPIEGLSRRSARKARRRAVVLLTAKRRLYYAQLKPRTPCEGGRPAHEESPGA